MKGRRDIVTDHAVLSYLERVYGVDIKALKRRIAHATTKGRKAGATAQTSKGITYRLSKTGRVITVHGPNGTMTNRGKRWRSRQQ